MKTEVRPDADAAARHAAAWLATAAREAVAARGVFTLAVSGGGTPGPMLRALSAEDVPWGAVHVFQVDERVAPDGHPDRNVTQLRGCLLERVPLPRANVHPMPVVGDDLRAAAQEYAGTLTAVAGSPPVLDVVQLGLGADGHTASLVPRDPVLEVVDRDVALTGTFAGRRRMTLTYPALDRARQILWLVTGAGKADIVARLIAGDRSIPAGRVRDDTALLVTDSAAAAAIRTRA